MLPGQFLAGEHPSGDTPAERRARVKSLLAAGVNCFVDLTMPQELEAYDFELPPEVEYLRESIQDHSVPTAPEQMVRIIEFLERALSLGRCV